MTDRYLLQFISNRGATKALSVRPDAFTLAVTAGCAIFCALLFGFLPAWLAGHASIEPALRQSNKNILAGRGALIRRLFMPAQIALGLAMVVIAIMLGASVLNLRNNHPGFSTDNVVLVTADFGGLPQKDQALAYLYRDMILRIDQMPGAIDASVAENTPLNGWSHTEAFSRDAHFSSAGDLTEKYSVNDVGAHYFATLGTQIFAGRDFAGQDSDVDTCIVNRAAANQLFPNASGLGQLLYQHVGTTVSGATARACRVVGIVEDAKYSSLRQATPSTVYLPFGANTRRLQSMTFVIHAHTLTEGESAYRNALHELAPASPEAEPVAFAVQFDEAISVERLLSVLSGFFAAIVMLLSSIGIYGLTASYVDQRTTEIGVRIAFGARRMAVFSMVMKQVFTLLMIGTAVGSCLAILAIHSIKAFLFQVSPASPALFGAAVLILFLSSFIAAALPARRAISIDPIQALRSE
jgi:predicted permease